MEKENNLFEVDKAEAAGQSISIKDVLYKYLNYGWLFAVVIIISLAAAWLYLRYTTPKYKVEATLMVRNDNSKMSSGGADAMFSSMLMMQSAVNKQNEIQLMLSRSMLMRVVKELGLTKTYYAEGKVKKTTTYKNSPIELVIVKQKDTTASFFWKLTIENEKTFRINEQKIEHQFNIPFETSEGTFMIKTLPSSPYGLLEYGYTIICVPEYIAAMRLSGGLDIKAAKDNSNVIMLEFTTEVPELGADVLNSLMSQYNQAAIEDKNETNLRVLSFLEDRLRLVESQLDSVETTLMDYRKSRDIIDLTAQSGLYFQNLTSTGQEIREQEVQIKVVELLENYIKDPRNRSNLVPTTMGITDPTLLELVNAYNQLVVSRQTELQTGANPQNPVVKNLDQNIEEARAKIQKSLVNIKGVYKGSMNTLEGQNKVFRNQISDIPEKEKGSRNIARQQEIKQSLYLYILQKKEESSIALASTIANARVLDPALSFKKQISPQKNFIYGMALVAGLLIPIIIIMLLDLFNDKVTTRTDITKSTQAPIIAEIGHNEGKEVLVFAEKSRSLIAEQIRILRSNLKFQLGDAYDRPAIMVTSSFSGEGKSFVSTNLAASTAITGKKTVILEFDLRKPKVMHGLGVRRSTGITTYLVGSITLEELPVAVEGIENLYVIPCGPVPPNPSELLLSPRIKTLFDWVRKEFEVVIIDTAPVGLVSDAMTLSRFADMTLYVVRQRYTFKRQLNMLDELYRLKKLPKIGLLVNDVIADGSRGYYGYGVSKYGYGYAYGASENSRKKKMKFFKK